MAFAKQLRLLLWKNVKLRKRQPVCNIAVYCYVLLSGNVNYCLLMHSMHCEYFCICHKCSVFICQCSEFR